MSLCQKGFNLSGSIFYAHNKVNTSGRFLLARTKANNSEGKATLPFPKILGNLCPFHLPRREPNDMHVHSVYEETNKAFITQLFKNNKSPYPKCPIKITLQKKTKGLVKIYEQYILEFPYK